MSKNTNDFINICSQLNWSSMAICSLRLTWSHFEMQYSCNFKECCDLHVLCSVLNKLIIVITTNSDIRYNFTIVKESRKLLFFCSGWWVQLFFTRRNLCLVDWRSFSKSVWHYCMMQWMTTCSSTKTCPLSFGPLNLYLKKYLTICT